jgi:hypothetical protein
VNGVAAMMKTPFACSVNFPADMSYAPRRISCSDHAIGTVLVERCRVGQCSNLPKRLTQNEDTDQRN